MNNFGEILEPAEHAAFTGSWQRIGWIPDFKTGELLNIGVVVHGEKGQSKIKLLDDFRRLNCLYDGKLDKSIRFINQSITNNFPFTESPFHNVVLSKKMSTRGKSIDECTHRLFGLVVTLAVPKEEKREKDKYEGLSQEKFLDLVLSEAKKALDPFLYRNYFNDSTIFMDEDTAHYLRVPINGKKLASLASCCYATPDTAENKLKDALVDLSVAANLKDNKHKAKRMFALLPCEELKSINKEAYEKIFNMVDDINWKAKKIGIVLDGHDQIDRVVESVIEYCE